MESVTVAVVGAGPVGLAALKCLREEGFAATAFESRDDIGGVWNYSTEPGTTTCLKDTALNSCRFISHFSDFPFPSDYPLYPTGSLMCQYLKDYADHFHIREHIEVSSSVKSIVRDDKTGKWQLTIASNGTSSIRKFDKIVLSTGLVRKPSRPTYEGMEAFQGTIISGQDYKSNEPFAKKNVLVVGIGNTAADVAVELVDVASKVYISHRRGAMVLSRTRAGGPVELTVNYHTLRFMNWLEDKAPSAMVKITDSYLKGLSKKAWETDPLWKLEPVPSIGIVLPVVNEDLVPCFAAGSVASVAGLRRFVGAKSAELEDGTILEDIDAVVMATGYSCDLSLTPWLNRRSPANYDGPPLPDLFLQIFPPEYADSVAFLNTYNAADCAWVLGELCAMAITQLWAGKSSFPSRKHMEASIKKQAKLNADTWTAHPTAEKGLVRPGEFYRFMHSKAGTGVREALSWGPSGWKFRLRDPEMSKLMGWGITSPHMTRLVDTGKRKAWSDARDAIKRANEEAKLVDKKPNKFRLDTTTNKQAA